MIEGNCPLCERVMRVGSTVTVRKGQLMHRPGDPACTPTVSGNGDRTTTRR